MKQSKWKPWAVRLIAIAGSVIALSLVFRKVPVVETLEVVRQSSWGWYLMGVMFFGLGVLGSSLRWHLMLGLDRASVHLMASVRAAYIGHFFNTAMVGASSGDVAKTALYSRWFGVPAARVLASCVLDRLVASSGGLVFAIISVTVGLHMGAFAVMERLPGKVPIGWIVTGISVPLVLLVSMGVIVRRHPDSFVARSCNSFLRSARLLIDSRRRSAQAFALAFATAIALNLAQLCCLRAVVGGSMDWLHLIWVIHLITIIASLPVTVAGTGLREGASMVLLALYGIAKPVAVAAALLTLSVHALWALFGAIVWWLEERHRRKTKWPEMDADTARISVVMDCMDCDGDVTGETIRRLEGVPEIREIILVGAAHLGRGKASERNGCRIQMIEDASSEDGFFRALGECSSEVILFVKAGTWVPAHAGEAVLRCLQDSTVVGGGFWQYYRNAAPGRFGTRLRCWIRLSIQRRVHRQQGIFVRRDALMRAMEVDARGSRGLEGDIELCRRVHHGGRIALAGATVRCQAPDDIRPMQVSKGAG
jgi:glycosyltransferase 2 family protein